MSNSRIKSKVSAFVLVCVGFFLTSCSNYSSHYKEESGTKTEYNHATKRFETTEYVSASVGGSWTSHPSGPSKPAPVKEKDLKKAEGK